MNNPKSIGKRLSTKLTLVLGFLSVLLIGCSKSSNRFANTEIPAECNVKPYSIVRFDKELMSIDPKNVEECMSHLYEKYGNLFDTYLQYGIEVGTATVTNNGKTELNKNTAKILKEEILSNKGYQLFFHAEDSVYKDGLDKEMADFTTAMSRFHSFFPNKELPKSVIAMFSCFGPKLAIGDNNELMVSMEYYIGSDFKPYHYVDGLYAYDAINLSRKMLVRDMVKAWIMNEFPKDKTENERLLDAIIYEGKIMYMLEASMPKTSVEDLMGYDKDQWEWCEKNEREMWNYVKENKHLYTNNRLTISKYINSAPHTVFFPYNEGVDYTPEAPGRAGIWLGWRIVNSYMNNNPEATLDQLNALTDNQALLEESGYNPK